MEPTCRDASTPRRRLRPGAAWRLRGDAVRSRLRGLAALAGLLASAGCGEEPGAPARDCDPLRNTGCAVAEKCSLLVESEDPFVATVTCVPSGNIPLGRPCGFGAPGPLGFDDCLPGSFCLDGLCTSICAPESGCAGADEACVEHGGVFEDRGLGLCTRLCDPLSATGCAPAQGCYLGLGSGQSTCHGAGGLGQGQVCEYIDACAPGLGCVLLDPDGARTRCTAMCDPATATTVSGQTCAQALGTGAPACVAIARFYGDTPGVPDDVGMCVDCADPGYADLSVCNSVASTAR